MKKDNRLVVLITDAQLKSLKDESERSGAPVAEIVRRAIENRKQPK
jgi:Ribbon-helix-helix domain